MHKIALKKPDGRALYLYSREQIHPGIEPTAPVSSGEKPKPHYRWHPLRSEWVIYASHRQNRTFLPPADYSPLAVTKNKEFPTEMPAGNYDAAVFENLFPSMNFSDPELAALSVATGAAHGVCEVVVFTQDPNTCLGDLPLDHVMLILKIWAERTKEISKNPEIKFVMPFENRGIEMGVTLNHPHGQIYAYPFVPPVPARMLESMKSHYEKTGSGLMTSLIEDEVTDARRLIETNEHSLSFIPVCARYPYETWVTPKRAVPHLHELNESELEDLARTLKSTLMKMDRLWNKPFPYLMTLYQAPVNSGEFPYAHTHIQIYPPLRTKDRLKYLAGTEIAAGIFVNDSLPEEKAGELREVIL